MNQNVLITGCSGLLAYHLIHRLHHGAPEPLPVISGITEIKEFQDDAGRQRVYHVDLRDRDKVFEAVAEIRPQIVYHLAAIANVGFSWKNQQLTYEVNFIGSSNLMEALHQYAPQCRVLMMSTAELYGNTKQTPYKETDILSKPKNPYALSKLAMEMLADFYLEAMNMDIIKIRAFNFTGPAQNRKFVASDFSRQIALIEKGLQEPVISVGNLSAVRDLSDVRDIARYLSVIAQQGETGAVYNVCSGKTFSIRQVLDILLSFSSKKIEVNVDEAKMRPVDVPILWGDNSLIKDTFQLSPQYRLEQTLEDLLNYWRHQVGSQAD